MFLNSPRHREVFLAGTVTYSLGFYWLAETLENFGGMPPIAAGALYTLFVIVCALQFNVALFVLGRLPATLGKSPVGLPIAWVSSQYCWIGIFPWEPGHTQLGFLALAQCADLLGATLITFVMWWTTSSVVGACSHGRHAVARVAMPGITLALLLTYGQLALNRFAHHPATIETALVQANVSIAEKSDLQFFEQNVESYLNLSHQLPSTVDLVLWPESVVQDWVDIRMHHVRQHPLLAQLPRGPHFILGALTIESKERFFNSALAIMSDGTILPAYHKRILMPFGEYLPFGWLLPFVRQFTPIDRDFTAGQQATVFAFAGLEGNPRVAPLICYEDIAPSLSADAVRRGATLLVNLTNDGWFGNSPAALQHHQIASFRAIETRRFLLRATNTGVTAVVNPRGETVGMIPQFSEGVLTATVAPLTDTTLFVTLGDLSLWRAVAWGALFWALFSWISASRIRAGN